MKGIMQCASYRDTMFTLSDSELLYTRTHHNTTLTAIDTTQLPKAFELQATSTIFDKLPMRSGSESQPITPRPPTHGHHPRFLALLDLHINDVVLRLCLESLSLPCAFEVAIPADAVDRHARHYNELTELRFSVYGRRCSLKARNLFLAVRLPGDTTHYLGPLVQTTVAQSARFVRDLPTSVTLLVDVDHCIPAALAAPLPCEMLLKEHVKTILENDDFCGSIAAGHVQNLVRDLPFYEAAMQRFRTWSEYVTLFAESYGCWDTVLYDDEDHEALGLSCMTPPGELRLVANCFSCNFTAADMHRDQIKWRALCDLRGQVVEGGGDFGATGTPSRKGEVGTRLSRHLMRTLSNEDSFRTLNSVNYLHVLEDLMSSHFVLFSELHPIQADRCMMPDTSEELLLTV